MNTENKNRLIYGLKMLGLFVLALLTIIVCVGVWNAKGEAFAEVCAGLLILANGFVIWRIAKRLREEYVKELRESTKL